MKTTENKTKKVEVRVTEDDYKLLKISAYAIGQTPSSMVRMFIKSTLNALRLKIDSGEINIEDYKTILDDQLQLSQLLEV